MTEAQKESLGKQEGISKKLKAKKSQIVQWILQIKKGIRSICFLEGENYESDGISVTVKSAKIRFDSVISGISDEIERYCHLIATKCLQNFREKLPFSLIFYSENENIPVATKKIIEMLLPYLPKEELTLEIEQKRVECLEILQFWGKNVLLEGPEIQIWFVPNAKELVKLTKNKEITSESRFSLLIVSNPGVEYLQAGN